MKVRKNEIYVGRTIEIEEEEYMGEKGKKKPKLEGENTIRERLPDESFVFSHRDTVVIGTILSIWIIITINYGGN